MDDHHPLNTRKGLTWLVGIGVVEALGQVEGYSWSLMECIIILVMTKQKRKL